MNEQTKIEWTDATWNPVTGCTKISEGCRNCYAERITERFHGKGSFDKIVLHPDKLDQPLRWKKSRRIFVNSMSDLFHEDVSDTFLDQVFAVMGCTLHSYQVLTKRPERMREYLSNERCQERWWDAMPGCDVWEKRERQDDLSDGQDDAMRRNQCTDADFARVGKKTAGRLLDGRTWEEFPNGL